jgi:DNA-binding response OmpR family regulator
VLIVSSDPATQDTFVGWLRDARVAAHGVSTVADAAQLARHVQIPIVVVEVSQSRDWRAVSRLRRHFGESVVIVLSALGSDERADQMSAQRIGCAGFLVKPCAAGDLFEVLERVTAPGIRAATS